jgi:hypothetical protein
LQTTAGKMIFGKFDERMRPTEPRLDPGKADLRKPQPIVVETPQTTTE